jgi:tetratricopeptide (TPR) repeat protein
MMRRILSPSARSLALGGLALALAALPACAPTEEPGKMPVTTTSEEARRLFLEGRGLADNLRGTDAREFFEKAVELDESFALAHLYLVFSGPTANERFASLERARAAAERVSEGERLWIEAVDAAVRSDPAAQERSFRRLAELYPEDERAHTMLGNYLFGQQDYPAAIEEFRRAIEINPDYAQPYNQLGYALRYLEDFEGAEKALKKYVKLIPDEPNPYDSYAEFLMKAGRFEESIDYYEKALEVEETFVPSYAGIGLNQILMGDPDAARRTFQRLHNAARNDAERRLSFFWTTLAYLHEGEYFRALEEAHTLYSIAKEENDTLTMAGDYLLMGSILLEAGEPDHAALKFGKAYELVQKSEVPGEIHETADRTGLFLQARLAMARDDLATARQMAEAYGESLKERPVLQEIRQYHGLLGEIAVREGDYETARDELARAGSMDSRVLYYTAVAYRGLGDLERARSFAKKAAHYNGLSAEGMANINYAFIRNRARKLLEEL